MNIWFALFTFITFSQLWLKTERPLGSPSCSVMSGNNTSLKYQCEWAGGTPQARLSFPELSNTSSREGNISLTVSASTDLNKKTVICMADHEIEQKTCNITASKLLSFFIISVCNQEKRWKCALILSSKLWKRFAVCFPGSPADFLPAVRTSVGLDGKIEVTLHCVSEASPRAVVSWSKDSEVITSEMRYQISSDTTQLIIRYSNVSNYLLHNYACTCRNPLGTKRRLIQLQGKKKTPDEIKISKHR